MGRHLSLKCIVWMATIAAPVFAQDSTTNCTTLYNSTHCDTTTTQPNHGGGKIGAFVRGYQHSKQVTQTAAPPAPTLPSAPLVPQSVAPSDSAVLEPNAPFALACRFDTGGSIQDKNLHVDPTIAQVDGHPATFGEDQIRYSITTERGLLKIKIRHDVVINRITGTVSIIGQRGNTEALGACVRATVRSF